VKIFQLFNPSGQSLTPYFQTKPKQKIKLKRYKKPKTNAKRPVASHKALYV
jgi:hypothetical protein